jgi:hypothetical protein
MAVVVREATSDFVAAAGDGVDTEGWLAESDSAFARIAGQFGRVEPRRRARAFLLALLSDVDSRSCWQLAEQAGDVRRFVKVMLTSRLRSSDAGGIRMPEIRYRRWAIPGTQYG